MKKFKRVAQLKIFDPKAEHTYYESGPARPPSMEFLDRLAEDMQLWIPGLPDIFNAKRILDMGAGTAPVGTVISQRFAPKEVISFELVLHRLKAANEWTRRLDNLSLVCGDTFALPFEDCSFDYVVANSFLHHLPNVSQAIAEIRRVLRLGGFYIGREPNFDNPLVRLGVFTFQGTSLFPGSTTPNEYPLRAKEIINAFAEAGCNCRMHYFWRRAQKLRHHVLSVAMSVRAERKS